MTIDQKTDRLKQEINRLWPKLTVSENNNLSLLRQIFVAYHGYRLSIDVYYDVFVIQVKDGVYCERKTMCGIVNQLSRVFNEARDAFQSCGGT